MWNTAVLMYEIGHLLMLVIIIWSFSWYRNDKFLLKIWKKHTHNGNPLHGEQKQWEQQHNLKTHRNFHILAVSVNIHNYVKWWNVYNSHIFSLWLTGIKIWNNWVWSSCMLPTENVITDFCVRERLLTWYTFTTMYHFRPVWNMWKIKWFSVHVKLLAVLLETRFRVTFFCVLVRLLTDTCLGQCTFWKMLKIKCFPAHISQLGEGTGFVLS
jgi:hypothetical protein